MKLLILLLVPLALASKPTPDQPPYTSDTLLKIDLAPTGTQPINGTCSDPNEELSSCAACELDCDHNYMIRYHENGKPEVIVQEIYCIKPCYENLCSCKTGYKRKNGVCIPESECLWIQVKKLY